MFRVSTRLLVTAASLACLLATAPAATAQKNFDLSVHASAQVTPAAIGLPTYPGATLAVKHGDEDAAFDIGFSFGETRLRLQGISYESADAPDRILGFYRKALSRYGEVLECDHGHPVGSLSVTSSGLRCSDKKSASNVNVDGHFDASADHDLRAGSPGDFRIAGVDGSSTSRPVHFVIMRVETPKDAGTE